MEADSWQLAARVRLMIGVMASVVLIAGVAFAAHTPTANRKIVVFREGTTPQASTPATPSYCRTSPVDITPAPGRIHPTIKTTMDMGRTWQGLSRRS
jgi:hypothetical protein